MFYDIKTNEEALSVGVSTYFTGRPCKNGHLSLRRVNSRICVQCDRIRSVRDKRKPYRLAINARRRAKVKREFPWSQSLYSCMMRAKKNGIPFDLTVEWAEKNWTGFCSLTGIKFEQRQDGNTGPLPRSASIDKIDPHKGYVQDNCRFILHCVNSFKGTMTDEEMINIAKFLIQDI